MATRCSMVKANGQKCGAFTVSGTESCIFHLKGDLKTRMTHQHRWSPHQQILKLERCINRIERDKSIPPLAKAQEIRALVDQIQRLEMLEQEQGLSEKSSVEEDALKKKIAKWKEKSQS